jgi:ABC-type dipeptide/oligopeptide/nickel transport system permease component
MLTYIVRRLLLMIPTLLGITIVVFTVMAAAPGGISVQSLIEVQDLEPEARKALEDYYNKLYGLDQPAPIQYLRWLNNASPIGFTFNNDGELDGFSLAKGSDLGKSFQYGQPVTELLAERVPVTLLLNILSLPIIYLIAISIGTRAAIKRGEPFDVGSGIVMLGLWSVPTMLAGVLLIGFFANDQYWNWFPTAGLQSREAQDMPFMPHWSNLMDIVLLFVFAIVGMLGFLKISNLKIVKIRVIAMALLGSVLAVFMANSIAGGAGLGTYLFLIIVIGGIFASIAHMDFPAFRTFSMGLIGFGLGIGLSSLLMEGKFVRGFLLDSVWHLVLPLLCYSYGGFAFLTKLTRTSVLENLLSDYARTARAKGVEERAVLWRHVFRNSLLPLITVSASLLPGLIAGSVIVESIFSIDGMGKLVVEAVQARDRELVLSLTLISGLLTLFGYLIADIAYAVADPRVSYE